MKEIFLNSPTFSNFLWPTQKSGLQGRGVPNGTEPRKPTNSSPFWKEGTISIENTSGPTIDFEGTFVRFAKKTSLVISDDLSSFGGDWFSWCLFFVLKIRFTFPIFLHFYQNFWNTPWNEQQKATENRAKSQKALSSEPTIDFQWQRAVSFREGKISNGKMLPKHKKNKRRPVSSGPSARRKSACKFKYCFRVWMPNHICQFELRPVGSGGVYFGQFRRWFLGDFSAGLYQGVCWSWLQKNGQKIWWSVLGDLPW